MNIGENFRKWLSENNISTTDIAKAVGVSRQVIWKVKNNIPCSSETAQKIYFATGGQINPNYKSVGRPRKEKIE